VLKRYPSPSGAPLLCVPPGIIGLLNAARLAESKPVIGFANPLLYQVYAEAPEAFTDVVVRAGCMLPSP
jgi:hypothetical protein